MRSRLHSLGIRVLAVTAIGTGTASADDQLVIASWGGTYAASQEQAYHLPYMRLHPGVKIVDVNAGAAAADMLRAQAEAGKVLWDLLDVEAPNAIALCEEGLVAEIDHDRVLAPAPDGTTASADFGNSIISPCFAPQISYSFVLGYRTDKFETPPASVADVFDLEKFPGRRALERRPDTNLEWALIADGVAPRDVYRILTTPEGVDRAFAKLKTIRSDVIWWTDGEEPMKLLASGEVAFATAYNGRLFHASEVQKQPVRVIWDGQILNLSGWVVPVEAPHKAEVMRFLRFATDTQRLADQAKYISYGPLRASSALLVTKHARLGVDMKPHMPTDPEHMKTALRYDFRWWAEHRAELVERMDTWLAETD